MKSKYTLEMREMVISLAFKKGIKETAIELGWDMSEVKEVIRPTARALAQKKDAKEIAKKLGIKVTELFDFIYPKEFREKAVAIADKKGVATAAEKLNIKANTIYSWIKKNRGEDKPGKNRDQHFNKKRRIAREIFINGFRSYEEYFDDKRNFKPRYDDIQNALYSVMNWSKDRDSIKWMSYDKMRIESNPFYRMLKTRDMKPEQYAFVFCLLETLAKQGLSNADIYRNYADIVPIEKAWNPTNVYNNLENLSMPPEELLAVSQHERQKMYSLSPIRPLGDNGLFERFPGLLTAVTFFSEVSPLGITGSRILDMCDVGNNLFVFKHRYITQALDSVVLYDLLDSIQNKYVLDVRVEKESTNILQRALIVPIQIRSSALDGRQYVFCWYDDSKQKQYRSLRLDYIHDIKRSEETIDHIEEVITKGRAYTSVLWGTTLTQTGSMRIEFSFDPKTEAHIGQRIEREKRIGHIENNGEGSKVLILDRVSCSKDIMPWLLSFTGYITKIESDNRNYQRQLQKSFSGHISSLNDMYLYKKYSWEHSDSPYVPVKEQVFKKWDTASEDKVIFSEFGCDYFECRRRILNKLKTKKTPKEAMSIIDTEIQRLGQSDEVRKNISYAALINESLLLKNDDGTVQSAFPNMVQRPFINTELRWIRAILEDRRIGLFLQDAEVKDLQKLLEKYQPLYNIEDVCYFDMYQDGDDFGSELLKGRFSMLCEAIHYRKPLVVTYKASANGKENSYIVIPLKIEYSHLESKLRLLAYNTRDAGKGHAQTRAYLLSRITKIEEYTGDRSFSDDLTWENFSQLCDYPLKVLVPASVKRNTLERFMIAFSPYKKEVVGYDEEREAYYIKIWYYKDDLKELLCKIRSYGSDIEVLVSPPVEKKKTPRDMITERISRQYAMLVEAGLIEW